MHKSTQRDVVVSRALWALIAIFVVAGFATAAFASVEEFRPELVVETCSFATALLLLAAEQRASRNAARRTAMRHATEELLANAKVLCDGPVMMSQEALVTRSKDVRGGLRLYYPHLATTALKAALVGGAMDSDRDSGCVKALSQWLASAEICNTRFAMAELLLFFLPATTDAMRERLQLHVSIVAGPTTQQRAEFRCLIDQLNEFRTRKLLPKESGEHLDEIAEVMERFSIADEVAEEVKVLIVEEEASSPGRY